MLTACYPATSQEQKPWHCRGTLGRQQRTPLVAMVATHTLSTSLPSVAALDRSASFPAVASGAGSDVEEGGPPPLKKARSEPLEDYSSCGAATKGASSMGQKVGILPCHPEVRKVQGVVPSLLAGREEDCSRESTGQGGHQWYEDTGRLLQSQVTHHEAPPPRPPLVLPKASCQ